MAARSRRATAASLLALVCLSCTVAWVQSNPVNIPLGRVPLTLWDRAWRALNDHSPTHHLYAHGNLINAQELAEPPYKIYKFTYDLNPICGAESCPREACTIDLRQDEHGEIETLNDSIQCMYFYPAETQNEVSQEQQSASYQEQEDSQITESLAEPVNNNRSVELDHEIQETGDENLRPFIAMRATGAGYCPGCPYELNPQLPGLLPFSEQALKSMDEQIAGDYKHKLVKVVRVTRSVPVSSNVIQYQLLLLIGESECPKNILEQEECPLRTTVPMRLCLVTFEQRPWQQTSLKISKNNCTSSEVAFNPPNQSPQPNLESQSQVTVKSDEVQPSRAEITDAYQGLKDMLDNYTYASTPSESSESSKIEPEEIAITESTVVRVLLNQSQDDEKTTGFSDKFKEYSEFLEDFNMPVKVEDVTRDAYENAKEEEFKRKIFAENFVVEKAATDRNVVNRRKRSTTGLVGAPRNTSVNDPEIQQYMEKALRKVSEESDEPNEPIVVEIVDATVQIVSGKLYTIRAKLGTSDCLKGNKDNCQLQTGSDVKDCLIKVWSQPWLDQNSPQITVTCPLEQTRRRKRSLRGANYSEKMLRIAEDLRTERLFEEFIVAYNRTYSSLEEKHLRLSIFRENLDIIRQLRMNEQGTGQYGVNMFADVAREEFRARYLGLRPDLRLENDIPLRQAKIPDVKLPATFDWRQKGVVTSVKNQGACGSCWAFSVTGNVEGQYALKHGQLLSLSEQELVDCDDLDEGCNGGLPDNAYRAIEKLGGLELESDYPYEAEDERCHFKKNLAKVQLASAVNITSNETQMAQWLVTNGPISIGINANAMQFYIGGVSHPFKFLCNPKDLDHGVLIVGYGTSSYPLFHKKLPYWIVKNSWGKRWGEQGYYRVFRGDGTCGLNTMASSAVVV